MRDADKEKITLRLPGRYLKALDFLVQVDDFPSRSEAVRAGVRDFLYARVELVTDKLKKMKEAERTPAEAEAFKGEDLNKGEGEGCRRGRERERIPARFPPPQPGV